MKRTLVVYPLDGGEPALKLEVEQVEMYLPGWLRFTMPAEPWELPTEGWYQVPPGCGVEIQKTLDDEEIMNRLRWLARRRWIAAAWAGFWYQIRKLLPGTNAKVSEVKTGDDRK